MKQYVFLLAILCIFSCKEKNKKNDQPKPDNPYGNGITLQSKNIQVKKAYLRFVDGTIVPENNKVAVGQAVDIWLVVDGWKQEDGKSYLGVSEKIESSNKQHIFEQSDMLATHPEGVSAEDAKLINVRAVINTLDKHYDYFLVSFRVWDKKGDGEITGSYKLYVE